MNRRSDGKSWALAHLMLAESYWEQCCHHRRSNANVVRAIDHLRRAAKVFTHRRFPLEWAVIQQMLGHLYNFYGGMNKIRRHKLAIQYGKQALKVCTRTSYPETWAAITENCFFSDLFREISKLHSGISKTRCLFTDTVKQGGIPSLN